MPCFAQLYEELGIDQGRHRLLVLGIFGLPCRTGIFVHLGDRLDRRRAADQRVARRDGRGLGALRGLHQDPDRRGRHRAGVRLRQVLGRDSAPDPVAADRPLHRRAAVAGLGVDGRTAGPHRAGLRQVDRRADGPGRARLVRQRPTESTRRSRPRASTNCSPGRSSPTRCGATTSHRSPTARPRSCSRPTTAPASCAKTRPGSPESSTASKPPCWARATSPSRRRPRPRPRQPPAATPQTSTSPRSTRRSPTST